MNLGELLMGSYVKLSLERYQNALFLLLLLILLLSGSNAPRRHMFVEGIFGGPTMVTEFISEKDAQECHKRF